MGTYCYTRYFALNFLNIQWKLFLFYIFTSFLAYLDIWSDNKYVGEIIQMTKCKWQYFSSFFNYNLNESEQQYQNTNIKISTKSKKKWQFCIDRVVYVLVMRSDMDAIAPTFATILSGPPILARNSN